MNSGIVRREQEVKYVHWLKIDGTTLDDAKQYNEVIKYLDKYPNAKALMYRCEYHLFHRIVRLECEQSYNDLDMMVNSFSNNLRRLRSKPKNLTKPYPFTVPDRIRKELAI
jgi:hypothetical protein